MILNLQVPQSWSELTQEQLHYACFLLSSGHYDEAQVKALTIIRWSRIRPERYDETGLVGTLDERAINLLPEQLAALLPAMDWLMQIPDRPVRLEQVQGHTAIRADLQGLPFEQYLTMENLYQGYIHTKRSDLLDQLTPILYGAALQLSPAEAYATFLWLASVKKLFAERFPHFFVPAPVQEEEDSGTIYAHLRRAMNTQIRALTKGDITKEKEILAMDTWRVLTELDAQAEEYEELKKQYNYAK